MQGLEDEGVDLMILVTSYSGKLAACMLRGLQSASSSTSNLVMAFEFEELFCSERKTMEGTSVLNSNSFISSKPHLLKFTFFDSFSTPLRQHTHFHLNHKTNSNKRMTSLLVSPRTSLLSPALALVAETIQKAVVTSSSPSLTKDVFPKIDKSGRFCSPRAARELALSIAYAACLEGSDPVRLFDKRVNAKRGQMSRIFRLSCCFNTLIIIEVYGGFFCSIWVFYHAQILLSLINCVFSHNSPWTWLISISME
ncbi:hypothetical protein AQUCO_00400627v1 [Aquilegia coerulea]|uniref:Uncharacterized protein n=1 Tax=Aquilegia coerulea TaxID=218851 RepID=A0A2G5EVY1_AQUCA|nr:hypothetical protein AQUCO_00400627v1 [Aquilegia coerulea]